MKKKTTRAILTRARALIAKGWISGWFAADKTGKHVDYFHPKACAFCAVGAIYKATSEAGENRPGYALRELGAALNRIEGRGDVQIYNDEKGRTQAEILAMYDDALAYM